ncbi:DnaJ-domain-containing protein, partial [Cucurbitaria berberidis CBS 394.84]
THYSALGLAPNAPLEVIRAAYKALVLLYHPDKNLHRTSLERISHAAAFRDIQQAYDVLMDPSLKAAYDAEPSQHYTDSDAPPTSKRRTPVKLTTPEEKAVMTTKARQQIQHLREQRAKRDIEESELDVGSLRSMIRVWKGLAEENSPDPPMKAHCTIRAHEYEQKLAERDRQHEEWLAKMATTNHVPSTPALKIQRAVTSSSSRVQAIMTASPTAFPTPTPAIRPQRALPRKHTEVERVAADGARAEGRTTAKAFHNTAKPAMQDRKVASVLAEKGKRPASIQGQARGGAGRISVVRAKASSGP